MMPNDMTRHDISKHCLPCSPLAGMQAVFNKSSLAAIVDEYSLEAAGVDREVWYEEEQEDMDTSFTSAADSLPTPALLSHAQQLSSVLYEAELHEAILAEVELQQQKHQHDLNQAADWVRGDQQQHDQGDQLAEQVLGSSGSAQLQVSGGVCAGHRGALWCICLAAACLAMQACQI
jgi:hypothetical protein